MIGVCIKYFHENYGGMLQAYATVSMLEARGLEYELIQYKKRRTLLEKIKSIPRLLNGVLLNDKRENLKKKLGKRKHPEFKKNDAIRMQAFQCFKEEHFKKLSPVFVGYKELCKGAKRYSAIVSGSDQLWSPAGLPTNFYNLMFVPKEVRKISYASSFGVSQIPWYQHKRTAEFLKRIEFISMRESRGCEIVKKLSGREVLNVLDPVFAFDKLGWETLVPIRQEFNEPYIFAYFLGDNLTQRKAVKEFAEERGCKIVALRHMDQYIEIDEQFGDYAPYDVGPDRFLNLLRGAKYICTDSFHGCCFAIIHEKKFVVFDRYSNSSTISKNSRIDSLCSNLGLQDRRYNGSMRVIDEEINYFEVYKKLDGLREITENYLNSAFDNII